MKVRILLSLVCLAVTLQAMAVVPMKLKRANNMEYPYVEGTRTFNDDGSINYFGDVLFDEEGAVKFTTTEQGGSGIFIQTHNLTEVLPAEYTVFAFDYKANMIVSDVVIFLHEYNPWVVFIRNGAIFTVSENWQTCYVILDRTVTTWGTETDYAKNYIWISSNGEAKTPGFELTVKNPRLLTMDETRAEALAPTTNPITDVFRMANDSWAWDYDQDMGSTVIAKSGPNPVWFGGSFFLPLPETHTTYCFDYKYMGGEKFQGVGYLGVNLQPTNPVIADIHPIEGDDPYAAEWKTCEVDFKDGIEATGWAKTFPGPDTDYVWFQCQNAPEGTMMWLKNARWVDPNQAGQDKPVIADEKADSRVFNLQGMEVKGQLSPGLYIQGGKKIMVR